MTANLTRHGNKVKHGVHLIRTEAETLDEALRVLEVRAANVKRATAARKLLAGIVIADAQVQVRITKTAEEDRLLCRTKSMINRIDRELKP